MKTKLAVVAAVGIVAGLWGASAGGWRDGIAGGTLLALFADGLLAQRLVAVRARNVRRHSEETRSLP